MPETSASETDRQKVWELIKDIGIALLTTHSADGKLHSRPLAASQKDFDGQLWFITQDGSPKISELLANSNVLLAYSDPKSQRYVSVSGTAEVRIDPAKVKEIWDANQRLWFPKGPDEEDIRLICVTVESAEYWDRPSMPFAYAYHYVKTRLTGQSPGLIGENKVVYFDRGSSA
jgi:general stress protein 26